jgi:hypothetical protein
MYGERLKAQLRK